MLFRHAGAFEENSACRLSEVFDGDRKKQASLGLASFWEAFFDRIGALRMEVCAASQGGVTYGDTLQMTPSELRDAREDLMEWQDAAARQSRNDMNRGR